MRVLLVHPAALMYSEIFLRLEPLGLERVAAALLAEGHDVRLTDLQVYRRAELERQVVEYRPQAVGFSLNYLANVPEVVDLAKWIKTVLPGLPDLRRRPQRLVRGRGGPRACRGRHRRRAQGRGRDGGSRPARGRPGPGAGRSARRGDRRRDPAVRRVWCTTWMTTFRPGTWAGAAASTSSG